MLVNLRRKSLTVGCFLNSLLCTNLLPPHNPDFNGLWTIFISIIQYITLKIKIFYLLVWWCTLRRLGVRGYDTMKLQDCHSVLQPPTNWGEDARLVWWEKKVATENLIDISGQQSIDRCYPYLTVMGLKNKV